MGGDDATKTPPSPSSSTPGNSLPTNSSDKRDWKFTQWFKKMPSQGLAPDADVLSAVAFDKTGKYLATGDKGGRIVLLEADPVAGRTKPGGIHYKFHVEFQSHEPEFDYVRSTAIEERIAKIRFLGQTNDSLYLLSTNDRAIKLWRIHQQASEQMSYRNIENDVLGVKSLSQLKLPENEQVSSSVVATLKRSYATDVHAFHINSLSINSDGETFMSSDNLRINLWNAQYPDLAFNVIDTKPANMQDLTEVITVSDFHPINCNEFIYATSKGSIRLADFRERALLDHNSKVFSSVASSAASPASPGGNDKGFFSDVTLSITDAKFMPSGQQFVTRDFMTMKVWDCRAEKSPLETIHVHEYLRPKLWDLFENDCVYDTFELGISSEGNLTTGSYNNYFHIYDMKNKQDTFAEASKVPIGTYPISQAIWTASLRQASTKKKRASRTGRGLFGRAAKKEPEPKKGADSKALVVSPDTPELPPGPLPPIISPDQVDYNNKVLHCAWHPKSQVIAVAGNNNLFLYAQNVPPATTTT